MEANQLNKLVRLLDRIDQNGQLSNFAQACANEARNEQLPNFRDEPKVFSTVRAQAICRVLQQITGEPHSVAQVRAVLQPLHPRAALAIELAQQFLPTCEPMATGWGQDGPSRVPAAEDDAQWNPVTGGPAIEKWEAEQHQLALAKAGGEQQPKRKW